MAPRRACLSQYLSKSPKITANTETAMLSSGEEFHLASVDTIVDKVGRDQRESSVPQVVEAELNRCANEETERSSLN